MKLNELEFSKGSRSEGFRKGRGVGSGNGKTCGKGQKGQSSRRQGEVAVGFEGGQTPLWRKLPKRGLNPKTGKKYAIINLDVLNNFDEGEVVDLTKLISRGYLKAELDGLKVLAGGELSKKVSVKTNAISAKAKEAIEKLGGTVEVL
jgi:large subunit ribosomal protein L15